MTSAPSPEHLILDRLKLRAMRLDHGLTYRELSERCAAAGRPVATSSLSTYESGRFQPEPANLKAIADALGVKPSDLLTVVRVAA